MQADSSRRAKCAHFVRTLAILAAVGLVPLASARALADSPYTFLVQPTRYDMPNGHTGFFVYHDDSYNGSGNTSVDGAFLSGGTGDLTDGIISATQCCDDFGPWVGWDGTPLHITFTLPGPTQLDSIRLHTAINRPASVFIWQSVVVTVDGVETFPFAYSDSDFSNFSNPVLTLPIGRTATQIDVALTQTTRWGFLSEVQFVAIPEPSSVVLAAVGLAFAAIFRTRHKRG